MPAPKPTPKRQAAIAAGIAQVEAGGSVERAARNCGVPATTLRDWLKRAYAADPEALKSVEDAIVATATEIALKAGTELAERVEGMSTRELTTAFGVATDKLAMRRGWGRGQDSFAPNDPHRALAMLAEALEGREVVSAK